MNSITIKNLDAELIIAIQNAAKAEGISTAKVVKKILKKALELPDKPSKKRDLSSFFGVWTEDEATKFMEANKIFDQIDEEVWK